MYAELCGAMDLGVCQGRTISGFVTCETCQRRYHDACIGHVGNTQLTNIECGCNDIMPFSVQKKYVIKHRLQKRIT